MVSFFECINPIYVSDHIARFSIDNLTLPILKEYDYKEIEIAIKKISHWQDMLGSNVFLENFPSLTSEGYGQPDFFKSIIDDTNCGLLFDISNAFVACKNTALSISK